MKRYKLTFLQVEFRDKCQTIPTESGYGNKSWVELSWIGCLTSQLTIFQSYMWRHIDVQADWRRSWTYGRAPNAIDISQGSLTCPSKHRHGTNLFYTVIPTHRPNKSPFTTRWGYGGHILDLTPRALTGVRHIMISIILIFVSTLKLWLITK